MRAGASFSSTSGDPNRANAYEPSSLNSVSAARARQFVGNYQPVFDIKAEPVVGTEASWVGAPDAAACCNRRDSSPSRKQTASSCRSARGFPRGDGTGAVPGPTSSIGRAGSPRSPLRSAATLRARPASGLNMILRRVPARTATPLARAYPDTRCCAPVTRPRSKLAAVRDLGLHIGMDDFGTATPSLTNLALPIDFFKSTRAS